MGFIDVLSHSDWVVRSSTTFQRDVSHPCPCERYFQVVKLARGWKDILLEIIYNSKFSKVNANKRTYSLEETCLKFGQAEGRVKAQVSAIIFHFYGWENRHKDKLTLQCYTDLHNYLQSKPSQSGSTIQGHFWNTTLTTVCYLVHS